MPSRVSPALGDSRARVVRPEPDLDRVVVACGREGLHVEIVPDAGPPISGHQDSALRLSEVEPWPIPHAERAARASGARAGIWRRLGQ